MVSWQNYYDNNGERIKITGIPDLGWITQRLRPNGENEPLQVVRVRTIHLPTRMTPGEAQADLDAYAKKRKWRPAIICGRCGHYCVDFTGGLCYPCWRLSGGKNNG